MAPSITPRVTHGTGTNPGIRQYFYTNNSDYLSDYHQYYMDLDLANIFEEATWTHLYSFRKEYNAKDLSAKSLRQVLDVIKSNSTVFQRAYELNTLMHKNGKIYAPFLRYLLKCSIFSLFESITLARSFLYALF